MGDTNTIDKWYHHFFKISYIARNGDGFTVNIPRGWWYLIVMNDIKAETIY